MSLPEIPLDDLEAIKLQEDTLLKSVFTQLKSLLTLRKKVAPLAKSLDEPQRLVTGIVLIPEVPDLHGDIYSADEIRKAAHGWMKRSQTIGLQHVAKAKTSMVESWVAPVDFELNGEVVKKGSWLLTTHVEDDAEWDAILKNGFTGYSIGGMAKVEDIVHD